MFVAPGAYMYKSNMFVAPGAYMCKSRGPTFVSVRKPTAMMPRPYAHPNTEAFSIDQIQRHQEIITTILQSTPKCSMDSNIAEIECVLKESDIGWLHEHTNITVYLVE